MIVDIMAVMDKTGKKSKSPPKANGAQSWSDGIPAVPATDLRKDAPGILGRVEFGGEEIILTRHGKPAAALVSMEVLKALYAIEDAQDVAAAAAARRDIKKHGTIPWAEVKRRNGI
ncbi:MAG: type II toxin-antitoxin system Phd/YefM family antitoxin [Candidatus Eremiobacteraeota bacterium]|nr:type II toxin-antitoxin system Phd/YefM family antitoxin [Candidatus Eremiobacteraeota bacterium]